METKKQQIIALHLQGLNSKQIAEQLGIPASGVRGRISEFNALRQTQVDDLIDIVENPDTTSELDRQQQIIEASRLEFNQHYLKNPEGVVFWMSDIHFPYARYDALALAFQLLIKVNPDWLTGLNDLNDNRHVSHWDNPQSVLEKLFTDDITASIQLMHTYHTKLARLAPNAKLLGLAGNHDNWLLQFLNSSENPYRFSNVTGYLKALRAGGMLVLSNDPKSEPVVRLGNLKLTHGISASNNDTTVGRKTILDLREGRMTFDTASGHTHRFFQVKHMGATHFNFGCLCEDYVPYMKHKPIHWQLGVGVLQYGNHDTIGEAIIFHEEGERLVARWRGEVYSVPLRKSKQTYPIF